MFELRDFSVYYVRFGIAHDTAGSCGTGGAADRCDKAVARPLPCAVLAVLAEAKLPLGVLLADVLFLDGLVRLKIPHEAELVVREIGHARCILALVRREVRDIDLLRGSEGVGIGVDVDGLGEAGIARALNV